MQINPIGFLFWVCVGILVGCMAGIKAGLLTVAAGIIFSILICLE